MCAIGWLLGCRVTATAQRGARRRAAGQLRGRRRPIDLTGYWVSVIIEDWKYRMVTPNKGVFDAVPLNPEGRKIGETLGSGARRSGRRAMPSVRRRRHHADAGTAARHVAGRQHAENRYGRGTQTRLLHFGAPRPLRRLRTDLAGTLRRAVESGGAATGSLKVVTTNLRRVRAEERPALQQPGDGHRVLRPPRDAERDQWLTVTTKVEDPGYFTRPYLTSSDFKKLPNAAGWNPTPCTTT